MPSRGMTCPAEPTVTSPERAPILVGTAGWSIPAADRSRFSDTGSVLERYASVFSAVEINTSFYRPHLPATYKKWADATPASFRFSVKIPKQISHVAKLQDCDVALDRFLFETSHMGEKLGCLLLQLPPSLSFEERMELFFQRLRQKFTGPVAFEPRHSSWLQPRGLGLLKSANLWLVEAHPSPIDLPSSRSGPSRYLRLHGSPRTYYSTYSIEELARYAARLGDAKNVCWCIFDNTALGAASGNALALAEMLNNGEAADAAPF